MGDILINADDFGKNQNVTEAIGECFKKGILSSTTLMVNMPYTKQAVKMAEEEGFKNRVGLHLNLTEGLPLTKGIRKSPFFCDSGGFFHGNFHRSLLSRIFLSKSQCNLLYEELLFQLKAYQSYELKMSHLDSHHHVHTDLAVLQVLTKLIRRYPIKSMRIGRNLAKDLSFPNWLYKKYINGRIKGQVEYSTDFFGSFKDYQENCSMIGGKSVEIMIHPMYGKHGRLMDTETPMQELEAYFRSRIKQ